MTRLAAPARRRQLLDVAVAVFGELGYHGATTARLAAAAGVTEPILYRHFADKRDLYLALLDETTEAVVARWLTEVDAAATPRERLAVLARGPAGSRGDGGDRVTFLLRALREPPADATVREGLRRSLSALSGSIRRELTSLQRAGVIRDDEKPAALAQTMLELILGAQITRDLTTKKGTCLVFVERALS